MDSSDSVKLNKDRVRKSVKSRLSFLTWEYKREASEFITNKVKKVAAYKAAKCVMLYVSTENEPDTEALIKDCLEAGRRVCLPRCRAAGEMDAVEIHSFSDLQPGKYGIPEPVAACDPVDPAEIDFCIVPCLAAGPSDRPDRFNRLGHGAGYYDRFLPRITCLTAVLCFKELVRDVPTDEYDVQIDMMINE